MKPRVAVVQRRMTHYRVPLFEHLRRLLAAEGIELRVLHGVGTPAEASKDDGAELPWAVRIPTRYLLGGRLCWQPFAAAVRDCAVVVVTQENKLLNNLPPLLSPWRRRRLAFWGHGRDMQAPDPDSWSERFKAWTARRVDWWFAYTDISAATIRAAGVPDSRITVLHNSIDTSALRAAIAAARRDGLPALRAEFGLGPGPVGLYIGSLYAGKRIDWLIESTLRLRNLVPGFQLLVAGAGPDRGLLEDAAACHPFVRYVGPVRDERKARCLAVADLVLNPGLVGLGVLDAFAAGLPMITTEYGRAAPEIAYLRSGVNGVVSADELGAFVDACAGLLKDDAARAEMGRRAAESADEYSIERMAERFRDGLLACLDAGPGLRA
ncbi:glycosyltransferase family 4 protein [Rubrivivax gelatinosus]|uniref:Glycosyl transferase, group 1 n=1 Tax=Rubrivivax gelatinosus (strain NBRC 100245 / IL144) TaxID=983917 RepID=I0HN35_RUBGI|nr:glycosyltransferase family 4 protein [Rubrivivax gelatinosus]BAL94422.1 glycosyl transferase, group 1 [Rubrivivax gelatinosus IL144]